MKKQQLIEAQQRRIRLEFEHGMIEAWKHIMQLCKNCIKAHRQEIQHRKRLYKKTIWE